MSWRVAHSLEKLRAQVNAKFPNRDKSSDGTIGDASHSAHESDHNPDTCGIVHAMDLTHDPASGFDSYAFADMMLLARDSRVKYIISNRRIASGNGGPAPWTWRHYSGINPHDHHVHVSVNSNNGDDDREWLLMAFTATAPSPEFAASKELPVLLKGSRDPHVNVLQTTLHIHVDGDFGKETDKAVRAFQSAHKLVSDGVVGPQTWKALGVS